MNWLICRVLGRLSDSAVFFFFFFIASLTSPSTWSSFLSGHLTPLLLLQFYSLPPSPISHHFTSRCIRFNLFLLPLLSTATFDALLHDESMILIYHIWRG